MSCAGWRHLLLFFEVIHTFFPGRRFITARDQCSPEVMTLRCFPLSCLRNSQSDNGKTKADNPTKSGLRSLKVTQALADWSSPRHLGSRASSGCLWTMSCWGERLTPLGSEGYGLERGEPDGDSVPKESFLTENLSGTSTDENWRWEIEQDFRVFMTYDHEDSWRFKAVSLDSFFKLVMEPGIHHHVLSPVGCSVQLIRDIQLPDLILTMQIRQLVN